MIRAIIIDDEVSGRETLSRLIEKHISGLIILDTASSVRTGLSLIREQHPDLVFLDIEMRDGTGFDLLESLDTIDFKVIFITAYSEYAVRAFKFYAVDYILKPVSVSELINAVEEVKKIKSVDAELNRMRIHIVRQTLNHQLDANDRIALPTMQGYIFENVANIIWCKADESYTYIYLSDRREIVVSKKMIEVAAMLEQYKFFRIHRAYMINLSHLQQYVKGRGGYVILSDGTELEVSRRRKEAFLQVIS